MQISNLVGTLCRYEHINYLWAWLWVGQWEEQWEEQWAWPGGM